jgi:hypothetical protein
LFLLLAAASSTWSQQEHVFGAFYRKEFIQVGEFVFTNMPIQTVLWEGWARGFAEGELYEAEIVTPSTRVESLTLDSEGALTTDLSTDFPAGSYSFAFQREDNSTFTVEVLQPAAVFHAMPVFANLPVEPVPPGMDLTLSIRPGADARASDVVFLSVAAFNRTTFEGWQFHTPWPGQSGALPGTITAITIPGSLLKPNDALQARLVSYRSFYQNTTAEGVALGGSAVGVYAANLMVADAPQDNDVEFFRFLTARLFSQSMEPALVPAGFAMEALVRERQEGRMTSASAALPGSSPLALEGAEDTLLWTADLSVSAEELLPSGSIGWTFDGIVKGRQNAAARIGSGAWPEPLLAASWASLQASSFTNDVYVRWTGPGDLRPADQVELIVFNPGGGVAFRAPDYDNGDEAIPGTETQVKIPAGTLADGETYHARLRHLRLEDIDSNALPGATGVVARCSETRFVIGSRTASPMEILTASLRTGMVAESYSTQLQALGGRRPWTWAIVQGSLPPGLHLRASGAIDGIPFQNGRFDFVVQAEDSIGNRASKLLTIQIDGTLEPLVVTTTSLPTVRDGLYAIYHVSCTGGSPPYHWSVRSGRLPPGLELHPPTGMICGIAEEAGVYPFEFELVDGAGQVRRQDLVFTVPSATNNPILRVIEFSAGGGPSEIQPLSSSARTFRLRLNARPDELVTLDRSTDLATWQTLLTTNVPGGVLEWSHPGAGYQFFRMRRGEPEPVYRPLTVKLRLDTNRVSAGILTSNGLSLSVTSPAGVVWRLDLPRNAVLKPVPVGMSLVESADELPYQIGFLGGVSFSPEGLDLLTNATLTATYPDALPEDAAGFGFAEQGTDFHLRPWHRSGNVLTFPIGHFSGAMAGRDNSNARQQMTDKATACSSQTSREAQLAHLIGGKAELDCNADRELCAKVWDFFSDWLRGTVNPKLKAAAQNDELLWGATSEALACLNLLNKYLPHDFPDAKKGVWKALASAFASAVNRSTGRCLVQSRPFQAIRMMKLAQAARDLGLGQYLEDPGLFDEGRMLERYKALFRFELEVQSSFLDIKPKSGGSFVASVHSEKCVIEAKEYDYGDEENKQKLTVGKTKQLFLDVWDLLSSENRISPAITEGQVIMVRLYIWPNYPREAVAGRCSQGLTWNDPTDPDIELVFDAEDPVKEMVVRTNFGDRRVPIPRKIGSMNWWGIFRAFHAMQIVDEHDESGQAHLSVPKIGGRDSDDWTYEGSKPFATADFSGVPKYAQQFAGQMNEESYLKLHHAPDPRVVAAVAAMLQ